MEKKTRLTGNERYFQTLPPKKERDEKRFNKWVDEAFIVFGFAKGGVHGTNVQVIESR